MRWRVGLLVLVLAGAAAWAAAGARPSWQPAVTPATKGTQCVEDTATMRRDHMRMLDHTRDSTVHGGVRGSKHSLKGCIDCHASAQTGSVAQAAGDFCVACHQYAAVKIDCFECHSSKPGSAATKTAGVKKP